jgi:hypothetical protein
MPKKEKKERERKKEKEKKKDNVRGKTTNIDFQKGVNLRKFFGVAFLAVCSVA